MICNIQQNSTATALNNRKKLKAIRKEKKKEQKSAFWITYGKETGISDAGRWKQKYWNGLEGWSLLHQGDELILIYL